MYSKFGYYVAFYNTPIIGRMYIHLYSAVFMFDEKINSCNCNRDWLSSSITLVGVFHYKALQLINFQIKYKIRSSQWYNIFSRKEETLFWIKEYYVIIQLTFSTVLRVMVGHIRFECSLFHRTFSSTAKLHRC